MRNPPKRLHSQAVPGAASGKQPTIEKAEDLDLGQRGACERADSLGAIARAMVSDKGQNRPVIWLPESKRDQTDGRPQLDKIRRGAGAISESMLM
uniref:Uncharacterized protein n=1 Tax=Thermogemmatispora argillosa TaxID=2045280 RepID=A0A455T6C6_9CHLR|nr:hypothetical protein KTA_32000 [Thermogemmatispora argillosa]